MYLVLKREEKEIEKLFRKIYTILVVRQWRAVFKRLVLDEENPELHRSIEIW